MNRIPDQLIKLTAAQELFVATADRLDPVLSLRPGVCGEWSPKDVVAHLVGWDESLLTFIVDIDNFEPPTDVDKFNEMSVYSRQSLSWEEALTEMDTIFQQLRQALPTVTPDMKIYPRVTGWLDGRTADYELHQGQLAAWL